MPSREHVASASIKVNGQPLEPARMDSVERIEVRAYRELPDMATLRLADPQGELVGSPPMFIGDQLEIRLGEHEAMQSQPVFVGEVVAFEPEYSQSSAVISVRAYDKAHRLQRERRNKTFQKQTVSDIVRSVAGAAGLALGNVDATPTVHDFVQQSMETDLDLLNRLAAAENCEFGVAEGKAFLQRSADGAGGTAPVAKWHDNVVSLKPRVTAMQQPGSVKVSGYDPTQKQAVVGTADTPTGLHGLAREARDTALSKFGKTELLVADRVATTQGEAKTRAQSTLDALAGGLLEAEGVMFGDPAVKPGGKLKLEGFSRFDGEHHVTSVTHVYNAGDFRTRFVISGRHPRTLTDVMRPRQQRDWAGHGLVIGLVTNIQDPLKEGRIRVKFPALSDDVESGWARAALVSAGKEAGMIFMPKVGDEVVVGFEHGDTRRPVVLGALHNSKDQPAEAMLGESSGGSLVIHGREDAAIDTKKQFAITAKDKMTIKIERGDKGPGEYGLETADKFELKAGTTIKLESTGDMTLKSNGGVTIEAAMALKLKGTTVDLDATAGVNINGGSNVNVKGAMINLG